MHKLRPSSISPLLRSVQRSGRQFTSPTRISQLQSLGSKSPLNVQRRWLLNGAADRSSSTPFNSKRFLQYVDTAEEIPVVRNPLNYIDKGRKQYVLKLQARKRLFLIGTFVFLAGGLNLYLLYIFSDPAAKKSKGSSSKIERLDAAPNSQISEADAASGVTIVQKPGNPDVKIDEQGLELVDTGTSSIPHFPKFIHVQSSTAEPAAVPTSNIPGRGAQEGYEEYSLIGLGIRTVSFLGVQVYVLGLYVRTTDLDKLQAAFVKQWNPLGSSLIPSEKESLRKTLMEGDSSLEIWDKVLRETGVRSAVRIVPTRSTDFAHLRDGWVRGITSRTQEFAKKGNNEFDDDSFGAAMQEFKTLLGSKGKAPKGSTILLTRDEQGRLSVMYEPEAKSDKGNFIVKRTVGQSMGSMVDERISRQVWLGYLGGKNVSSEAAKKSIVDGVMELVERPVGTVGAQIT